MVRVFHPSQIPDAARYIIAERSTPAQVQYTVYPVRTTTEAKYVMHLARDETARSVFISKTKPQVQMMSDRVEFSVRAKDFIGDGARSRL